MDTKDAVKGRNRPKSLAAAISGAKEKDDDVVAFSSGAEFEAYRRALIEGQKHGN